MFPSKVVCEVASQPFKRAQTGLFHGKTKLYGNNVPFSKHKTRRSWLPNVQHKRLRSEVLNEEIRVKLTTRALKTINKKGGLDNYLKTTSGELLGDKGMELRMKVRAKEAGIQATPTEEEAITTITDALHNSFTSASGQSPKANEWTARSARLVAGWALGKKVATAKETIDFYTKLDKKVEKITKVSTKFSNPLYPSPKHGPYRPHPHAQLGALPQKHRIPIKAAKPTKTKSSRALALV